MRIVDDVKLDYSDVLFRPKRSTLGSRSEVFLNRTYTFKHSNYMYSGIPIMAANMDGVGTVQMAKALKPTGLMTVLTKGHTIEDLSYFNFQRCGNYLSISTGITDTDMERTTAILGEYPDIKFVCIDVANGYSERFIGFVEKFREMFPDKTIIAGNVVTPDITEELILRGADIVKVGIGPGSVCTTRLKTGVGYPQLSAVIECADAAHGLGGHIIADGGCSSPGDVAKAFGAGADFVMLGGMLAGHDEGGGELVQKGDRLFVEFYGMSSSKAQDLKEYRSSEGRVVSVPYRGPVDTTVSDILGGLRSTCTYVGAASLKELSKRTTFVRVNNTHNRVYESITTGE